MKTKQLCVCFFAFFLVLLTSIPVWAVPASPDPVMVSQPDGSSFQGYLKGDEYSNWMETAAGYTAVKNQSTGFWEYALKGPSGSLIPSGQIVTTDGMAPASFPLNLKPEKDDVDRLLSSMKGTWTPQPVSGAKNLLIILVNFANQTLATTATQWSTNVFSTTAGVKSVANYYKDNSFGTMTINPVSHTQPGQPAGVVTVAIANNHPNNGSSATWANDSPWMQAAVTAAGLFVNFDSFDTNGDGILQASEVVVYLVAAGYEASGSSKTPSIWAMAWNCGSDTCNLGITAGTKGLNVIARNGELYDNNNIQPMGVICHELGHQLCKLPDLYDTSSTNQGLGYFSLMASGSWGRDTGEDSGTTPTALDAWCRQFTGWLTPVVADNTNALRTLGPALSANNAAVKLIDTSKSSAEYFLVENRYATGWDLGLHRITGFTGGMLITHIDTTSTPGSNDFNKYGVMAHQGCVPEQASTAVCDMLSPGATCRGDQTTLFYSGNNSSFGPATTPNSNYYTLGASNFAVTNISAIGSNMTANFYSPTAGPDVTPPTVTSTSPTNGATDVAVSTTVTATFSENVDSTTVNTTTFTVNSSSSSIGDKTDQPMAAVTGTVTYSATTNTATFTPTSSLGNSTTYTVTIKGGASGVKDLAANAMTADYTFTFTTIAGGGGGGTGGGGCFIKTMFN